MDEFYDLALGDSERQKALLRSKGMCQFCGHAEAFGLWSHNQELNERELQAAVRGEKGNKATADALIALCEPCTVIWQTVQHYLHVGGDPERMGGIAGDALMNASPPPPRRMG